MVLVYKLFCINTCPDVIVVSLPFLRSRKFFVFEEIFQKCRKCGVKINTTRINVFFSHYNPALFEILLCINRIPAGDLLLSTAILYSGLLPTKVLRLLIIYGCASISRNTFFIHQESIFQPMQQGNVYEQVMCMSVFMCTYVYVPMYVCMHVLFVLTLWAQ